MKRCTYCGQEHPDDATECSIDAMPLEQLGHYAGAPPPRLAIVSAPPVLIESDASAPPVLHTFSELVERILEGGRFVVFQYCFSIVVLSFKRSSEIIYVPPGEDAAGPAVSNSMISLLAGWWGIPWGPIWTISTVFNNTQGGVDVTYAVLTERVGAVRAAQVMARRRVVTPQGWGLKAFRWGLGGFGLALLMLPFILAWVTPASKPGSRLLTEPGETEFQNANHQISFNRGGVAFGNSPEARAVANQFSTNMKKYRQLLFEVGKQDGFSASGHEFLTYCELHDSECAIIVHVPELRWFTSEAKESLGELAWETAQMTLQQRGVARPGMRLAVGLRGFAVYDRVLTGTVVTDLDSPNTGVEAVHSSARSEQVLYPFFKVSALRLPSASE